jgi:hypothetical protein
MFSTLIMGGWTPQARGPLLAREPIQIAVEGEIEVEPRLLAVGDDIEASRHLVVDCADDGVVHQLCNVGAAELVQVLRGKF